MLALVPWRQVFMENILSCFVEREENWLHSRTAARIATCRCRREKSLAIVSSVPTTGGSMTEAAHVSSCPPWASTASSPGTLSAGFQFANEMVLCGPIWDRTSRWKNRSGFLTTANVDGPDSG